MGWDPNERVDVIDRILREAAVGRKAVGSMSLIEFAVIAAVVETRRVHPPTAALASAAARMDFNRHPVADDKFVDCRSESHNRAHVLVARGEVPVERRLASDDGGRAVA